jgi:hypothetical protein
MAENFPWYAIVTGDKLQQGDLIGGCRVPVPPKDLSEATEKDVIPVSVLTYDLIILTQSCDLVLGKTDYAIVCPHFDLAHSMKEDVALKRAGTTEMIRKRQMPRYALLSSETSLSVKMGIRLVDFGQVFSLPIGYLSTLAAKSGDRLRLLPPYREFIAQSFASFFMRIGLPVDIKSSDLPK